VTLVTLRMTVRPESGMMYRSNAGDARTYPGRKGGLELRLYEEVGNGNALILVEEWETQEDLERHLRTDNQRRLLELMDLSSEQPELRSTRCHTRREWVS